MADKVDKFKNLKEIDGFDEKFKIAGDPEYNQDDFVERHAQGKEFHQAIIADDPSSGSTLKSLYEDNLPGDRATFDAKIEEIYGKGSTPVVRKLIEAQIKGKAAGNAGKRDIDHLDTQVLSRDVANYYIIQKKAAVETIVAGQATIIDASDLDEEAKKKQKDAARTVAQRFVDEDEDGILTEGEVAKFGSEYEAYISQELKKIGKFDHQNYLLGHIGELGYLSKARQGGTDYSAIYLDGADYSSTVDPNSIRGIRGTDDKILSLYDTSTNPISKLRKKNKGYGILSLPTEKLSQLVPSIKLFKLYTTTTTKKGSKKKSSTTHEVEIPFPTTSLIYANSGKNFGASSGITAGSQDPSNFFKNRDGFGIKSFDWTLAGKTEVTAKTDITANLNLYFQDFGQLTTPRKNKKGQVFRYLDLVLEQDEALRQGIQYLKIVVGWAVPLHQGLGSFTSEELDIIRENSISLKMTTTDYSIVFNDSGNGTFELGIEYRSWEGEFTTDTLVNILLPDKENCKILGELSKVISDAEKNNLKKVDGKTVAELQTERNDIESKMIPETHTKIMTLLTDSESIYHMSLPLEAVFDFQGVDTVVAERTLTSLPSQRGPAVNSLVTKIAAGEEESETKADDDGNVDIYYTFLGDIIQAAMINSLDVQKLQLLNKGDASQADFIKVLTTDVIFGNDIVNIADIPIDIRFFASFFWERVTNKTTSRKSLSSFIGELLAYMLENRIGDFFSKLAGDNYEFETSWFNFENKAVGVQSADTVDLKDGIKYSYLAVYPQPVAGSVNSSLIIKKGKYAHAKKIDQTQDGIYHFILGAADSIVKTASFEKTDLKFEKERRLVEGSSPFAILRNVFQVNLRLYGNTLFWPGSLVFINPSQAVGDGGHPWIPGSIFNIMGFGGYHQIISVKNSISDNTFETALETKFINSGNPPPPATKGKTTTTTASGLTKGAAIEQPKGLTPPVRTEGSVKK